jgi:hypothetical protein
MRRGAEQRKLRRCRVEVIERVEIKNSADRNYLYTLFTKAAMGDYKHIFDNREGLAIDELDQEIRTEFDNFAQKCFDKGREFERCKQAKEVQS